LVGDGVNFNAGASAQFEATIVIRSVSLVQVEEPIRSRAANTRSAHLDQRHTCQAYRRVFKPTHQLMSENLPPPNI
jgi:hypothetical protein